jgi:hypothetical protein
VKGKGKIVLLCGLSLWAQVQLRSQDKPEPPRRGTVLPADQPDTSGKDAVPKIDLPEFEITGEELIRLDAMSKSAVDDSWNLRSSTLEKGPAKKAPLASLGTAETAGLSTGGGFTGRTYAGLGSFQTPTLDLWLGVSSPTAGLLLRSGYTSSAGHVDHADYRDGFASLSGNLFAGDETFLPGNVTLSGTIGFSGRAYRFYGATTPELQRTINRVQGSAAAGGDLDGFSYDAQFSLNSTSVQDQTKTSETEVGFRGTAAKSLEGIVIRGSADLWTDHYSPSRNPYVAGMSVDAGYEVAPRVQLTGGLGFYATQGSEGGGDARLYPLAGVLWQTTDRLTLSARFAPFLQRSSLSSLLQQNPYLMNNAAVRHPDYHTNFELVGDAELSRTFSGRLAFRYQRADDLPVWIEQTLPPGSARPDARNGVWDVDYSGTTRIFGLDAEISANLTTESYALLSVAWRNTENSSTGKALPYAPEFQAGATYRHSFPVGVTLQTDLNIYGSQFADPATSQRLTGYTLWDIRGEYQILPLFAVGVGIQNILDQSFERWKGYAGVPRTAMLFGRYSW